MVKQPKKKFNPNRPRIYRSDKPRVEVKADITIKALDGAAYFLFKKACENLERPLNEELSRIFREYATKTLGAEKVEEHEFDLAFSQNQEWLPDSPEDW